MSTVAAFPVGWLMVTLLRNRMDDLGTVPFNVWNDIRHFRHPGRTFIVCRIVSVNPRMCATFNMKGLRLALHTLIPASLSLPLHSPSRTSRLLGREGGGEFIGLYNCVLLSARRLNTGLPACLPTVWMDDTSDFASGPFGPLPRPRHSWTQGYTPVMWSTSTWTMSKEPIYPHSTHISHTYSWGACEQPTGFALD